MPNKQRANTRPRSPGRPKGSPNKTTALLKDAILRAAELAGGPEAKDSPGGLVAYLQTQATANPGPFMALLGKVLPMQIGTDPDNPLVVSITRRIVSAK